MPDPHPSPGRLRNSPILSNRARSRNSSAIAVPPAASEIAGAQEAEARVSSQTRARSYPTPPAATAAVVSFA